MAQVIERSAVRAVLLADDTHVLLMQIHSPTGKVFWITPGGGLDPDETVEGGLRRELKEELGLEAFDVGPALWRRQHTFDWGDKRFCQREHYYVVHTSRFEPRMSDPVESVWFERFRWWPIDELHEATEEIAPRALGPIVSRYLAEGAPAELPEWEVLID
jgi:8-oxo-dGTP pyrophosphatase MutT (NUDIX family)